MLAKRTAELMGPDENQDDNFVFAPPQSSDEEGDSSSKKATTSPQKARKAAMTKTSSPSTKRPASTAASARTKRRKPEAEPTLDAFKGAEVPTSNDLFPGFIPSGSQKRRQNKGYANRRYSKPDPTAGEPELGGKDQGFKSYDAVETHEKPAPKTSFKHVEEVPALETGRGKIKSKQQLAVPDLPDNTPAPKKSDFRKPDLPAAFSSSGGTEVPSVFESFDSPEKKGRKRSGSTSSLSSVDDMFILAHDDEFKAEVEADLSVVCCPVCQTPVHDSTLLFVPDNLRTMPFQQQHKFCAQHRVVDAKEQWQERGYPKIYWDDLESFQIPKKLPHLKRVISRETSSFYLDELDTRIKNAKGNRRKIRNYLNEGLIDVARPGYYGPKGARIMVNAITESLTETLNKALRSDTALRVAGVGAYVSAVLVPELTLQLVMGDLKLKTPTEGRKVLDESTDIGVLLNPDDDRIERRDEDED